MIADAVLCCALDGVRLGLPLMEVLDVTSPPTDVTPTPLAPPGFDGVTAAMGRLASVIDLRTAIGLPADAAAPGREAVWIEHESLLYALIFDAVGETVAAPADGAGYAEGAPLWARAVADRIYPLEDGPVVATRAAALLALAHGGMAAARAGEAFHSGIECARSVRGAR